MSSSVGESAVGSRLAMSVVVDGSNTVNSREQLKVELRFEGS